MSSGAPGKPEKGFLPEIAEDEASGEIAEIYYDIRACGFPMVNFVYRSLATRPEVLRLVWEDLKPNFSHEAIDGLAGELMPGEMERVTKIPGDVWPAVGIQQDYAAAVRTTLAAYNYANSRNLLGFHALLSGTDGTGEVKSSVAAGFEGRLLPRHDPARLSPAILRLVEGFSREIAPETAEGVVVPSLLRHLVDPPCLAPLLWTAVTPGLEELEAKSAAVGESAGWLAQQLPCRVRRLDDQFGRRTVELFSEAAANMLIVGSMFERAVESIDNHAGYGGTNPLCRP